MDSERILPYNMFTDNDISQIERRGSTLEYVKMQMENFRRGFGYLPVERPARIGDGILSVDMESALRYASIYDREATALKRVKFVPASGAATRMFRELYEFMLDGKPSDSIERLTEEIENFAFYDIIKKDATDTRSTVKAILDYGAHLPKALILFHKYPDMPRTAMDEHLAEGAMYAASGGTVHMHMTISAEHKEEFLRRIEKVRDYMEGKFGVRFDISFSPQHSGTDMIAVTPDNEPFREMDGGLLFRPAGHGALLENLNRIDADMVFIKNVDNVAPDRLKADTTLYKKALAGMMVSLQKRIFSYLDILYEGTNEAKLGEISSFIEDELCYKLPPQYLETGVTEQAGILRSILNRPLRVCGMVRNEGEPGGGPFWVRNGDGSLSLQIAESSQIAPGQSSMMKDGTHFNPVDLVCGIKDYKGRKFDLWKYIDPSTGFISEKSNDGRKLKAQELPGLWNGAMAAWNTVFAEVPISTFTPVKTLADLLRPQHQ